MKRRLFTAAVIVSLAWCVAAGGMWVLSGRRAVMIPPTPPGKPVQFFKVIPLDKQYEVTLSRGSVATVWHELTERGDGKVFSTTYINADPGPFSFKRAPVGMGPSGRPWGRHGVVVFPIWVLMLMGVALPTWYAVARVRDRRLKARRAAGLCTTCGYDLRGSPDRCPECGAVPDDRATATA